MFRTRQKKRVENIPVKTAFPVSNAAMTAAGYASAKNPVTVKNTRKASWELHTNWNVGILEWWNNGFRDKGMVSQQNQNE